MLSLQILTHGMEEQDQLNYIQVHSHVIVQIAHNKDKLQLEDLFD